eukprot:GEMP01000243.1.p1 GENE.GEMP01000243.1~~GEMP01000243.1.p1  ORF type:complete len:2281 (+),score=412.81 GEMP01000243.1:110-6844(+)
MAYDARAREHVFEVVHTEQAQAQLLLATRRTGGLQDILDTIHHIACGRTHEVIRRYKVARDISLTIHHAPCCDRAFSVIFTYDFRCDMGNDLAQLVEVVKIWSIVDTVSEKAACDYIEKQWSIGLREFERLRAVLANKKVHIKVDEDGAKQRYPRIIQTHVPGEALWWVTPFYAFAWQHSLHIPGDNLRLILASEEEAAARVDGILVLDGRAGAGKTVVMRERLWAHYNAYLLSGGVMQQTILSVTLNDTLASCARDQFIRCHEAYLPDVDLPLEPLDNEDVLPKLRPGVCIVSLRTLLKMLDDVLPHSANGRPQFFLPIHHVREASMESGVRLDIVRTELRQELSFEDFKTCFWRTECKRYTIGKKQNHFDVRAVWQELQSFVKGNQHNRQEGVRGYMAFWKQMIGFSGQEEVVKDVANKYDAWCRYYNLWDRQDAALHILQRLEEHCDSPNAPALPRIDELFVDEVQDLSSIELTILLRICTLHGLSVSGDAAQIVSDVKFRFCDFRALLNSEIERRKLDKAKVPVHIVELAVNHRSDEGIVKLSNFVLELLQLLFPTTIDKCFPACATHRDATPAFMTLTKFYATFVPNKNESWLLGADQIILSPSTDVLPKEDGARHFCATPAQVKGLEYDDVFIFNWFSKSNYRALWKELAKILEHGDLEARKQQLQEIWKDHQHAPLHIDMKHLIGAVTRARFGLVFVEEEHSSLMECLMRNELVEHELSPEAGKRILDRGAQTQTKELWICRGNAYFELCNYKLALSCYQRYHSESADVLKKIDLCEAYLWKRTNETPNVERAYRVFQRYELWRLAADCLVFLRKFETAGDAYEKAGEYILAAHNLQEAAQNAQLSSSPSKMSLFQRAGRLFVRAEDFERAMDCFKQVSSWVEYEDAAEKGFLRDRRRWWPEVLSEHGMHQCASKLFEERGEYSIAAAECLKSSPSFTDDVEILRRACDLFRRQYLATGCTASLQRAGEIALKIKEAPDLWKCLAEMLDKKPLVECQSDGILLLLCAELWEKVVGASPDCSGHPQALKNAASAYRGARIFGKAAEYWEKHHRITCDENSLREAACDWRSTNTNWDKELECLLKLGNFADAARNRQRVGKWLQAAVYWSKVEDWCKQGDCLIKGENYPKAAEAFFRLTPTEDGNYCARVAAAGVEVKDMNVSQLRSRLEDAEVEQLRKTFAFIDREDPVCGQQTISDIETFLEMNDDQCDFVAYVLLGKLDPTLMPRVSAIRRSDWFAEHVVEDKMNGKDVVILPKGLCDSANPFFCSATLEFVKRNWVKREVLKKIKLAFTAVIRTGNHEFHDARHLVDAIFELTKVEKDGKIVRSLVDDDVVEAFWAVKDGIPVPKCFEQEAALNGICLFTNVVRAVLLASNSSGNNDKYISYLLARQRALRISDIDVVQSVRHALERDELKKVAFLQHCGLRYIACEHPDMWALLGKWSNVSCNDAEVLLERGERPSGNDCLSVACRNLWDEQRKNTGKGEIANRSRMVGGEQANFIEYFEHAFGEETSEENRMRAARCFCLCLDGTADSCAIVTLAIRALAVFRQVRQDVESSSTFFMDCMLTSVERRMLKCCGYPTLLPRWRCPILYFPEVRCPDLVHLVDPTLRAEYKTSSFEMRRLKDSRQCFVEHNCSPYVTKLKRVVTECQAPLLKRIPPATLVSFCDCCIFFGSFKGSKLGYCIGALLENIIGVCENRDVGVVCAKLRALVESAPHLENVLRTWLLPSVNSICAGGNPPVIPWVRDLEPSHLRMYIMFLNNIKWEEVHASLIEPLRWQDIDATVPHMLDTHALKQSSALGLKFIERELATDGDLCLRMLRLGCAQQSERRTMRCTLFGVSVKDCTKELDRLKANSGVHSTRSKKLADVIAYWLPKRVVPLDVICSREMIELLFLFKSLGDDGIVETRTLPPSHKMDLFGEAAIHYGREALLKCIAESSVPIVRAYSLFMLADESPSRSWYFIDEPRQCVTTRQKFWQVLEVEQTKLIATQGQSSCLAISLDILRPLYVRACALFRTAKGTPMDAAIGKHFFRSPPMDFFVNAIQLLLRECESVKQKYDKYSLDEVAAEATVGMAYFNVKRNQLQGEWRSAKKNLAKADVSDILCMATNLLETLAAIKAPEVLSAMMDGLNSMIQEKPWMDEHFLIFVERVRDAIGGLSYYEKDARSGMFILQCCCKRVRQSDMGSSVNLPLANMLSEEDWLEFLLGRESFLTEKVRSVIAKIEENRVQSISGDLCQIL